MRNDYTSGRLREEDLAPSWVEQFDRWFADVVAGGPVTIKDGAGAVLATTELVGGTLSARGCTFTFSAEVSDADFYQVAVTRRGSLNFSRTDLATTGWRVLARL